MSQDFNEKQLMFKLVKIYVVEYLTTIHGFKNFHHEAINILAMYVVKTIQKIANSIKRVLSMQKRTIPNCLHVVNVLQKDKIVNIFDLVQFIAKMSSVNNKNLQVFYVGLDNLSKSVFSEETYQINQCRSEINFQNIKYIPYVYTYNPQQNPLPIRLPVDEGLKKPAQYTYKNISDKVQKVEQNVEKLGNYSARQMRRSLGILNSQQQQEKYQSKGRKTNSSNFQKQIGYELSKNKFSMIKFI